MFSGVIPVQVSRKFVDTASVCVIGLGFGIRFVLSLFKCVMLACVWNTLSSA